MSASFNTANLAELAISELPPNQYVSAASKALPIAKAAAGMSGVPNDMIGSVVGGLAGPYAALASAALGPDPSMTANVSAHPSVKYGDRYMANQVGQSKNGSFVVQSGKSDSNLENRQQVPASSIGWKTLAIAGIVLVFGFFVWRRTH